LGVGRGANNASPSKKNHKSLKLVILAVAFGMVCFNITGGVAMTGYLKALGTSDFVFGLIYAITPLAAPFQVVASFVLERTRKRKLIFMSAGLVQRVAWLPFGLVPFFVPMGEPLLRVWMASLFILITALSGPFMNVSFFSLAADIVPDDIRGRYFAVRSRVATVFAVAGGILTAWFLDSFSGFVSYAMVFALASLGGTLDILCFIGVKFPEMHRGERAGGLPLLFTALRHKAYMRFVLFVTLWQLSLNLSAPFYFVHLRNEVMMSNTLITLLVQILPNIISIIFVTRWGRMIDAHGNKTVMRLTNGILCVAPFIWIFTANNAVSVALIVFAGLMQGLLFSGFEIGTNNIMMSHAPREGRSMYIAVYFMFTSMLGIGLGNAAGGWLLDNVFSRAEALGAVLLGTRLSRYNYLFALTAVLRCVMVFVALPLFIREENNTPPLEVLRLALARIRRRLG
jgi:MFS family permease